LLIIDEFQEFFSEDDKAAQEASLLLDRLVRQGRAFGVHVILGSQTIGGSASLPRTTLGQMAVRVALQTTEADSQLILGDGNFAARLLSRPGEAIYNDAGGAVEANSPFQVCWLTEQMKIEFLQRAADGKGGRPMVFEGNEPADFGGNAAVSGLRAKPPVAPPRVALAYVGEPVAIKAPTAVPFRRQSGSNLLVVSQQDQPAAAMMVTAVQSLGLQYPAGTLEFHLVDGTAADSPLAGVLAGALGQTGAGVRVVDFRSTEQGILDLHEIVKQRRDAGAMVGQGETAHYLVVAHGQRFRQLRRSEESFSFSMGGDDGAKKVAADKALVEIIRDGPPLGVHVMLHLDTMASFDRTFERGVLREFDQRILCQMSQSDSTTLIDSTVANRLGFNRALLFSEEGGTVERFRPYRIPQ
jgi:S-DNA-T family DNA segregation ATPase FtsK/SpoIIIE